VQGSLFEAPRQAPRVTYHEGWARGRWTIGQLLDVLRLCQRTANMYGKVLAVPRLEAWYGLRPYAFGGRVEQPQPWPELLVDVRAAANTAAWLDDALEDRVPFDSCFANLYRGGADHIPWHADDDEWIGPVVASVTFGAARRFRMRLKADHAVTHEWSLGDGDLFVMHAGTQRDWEHCVPPTAKPVGPRLNLTFRQTIDVRRG
jgi:alkylated DNA repair dioxygenase AlkB